MSRRDWALIAILGGSAAAGVLLAVSHARYEVGLGSVVELWADLTQDVDRAGLAVTRVSPEREMEIGREIENRMRRGSRVQNRTRLAAYVEAVGATVAANVQREEITYRFTVVESPAVNAFALPGGGVFVTTGMIGFLESEAELAAVLGHEIRHVDLRHCIERLQYELALRKIGLGDLAGIAELGYSLIGVGFSEQQELEADARGAWLAAEAGYDPRAAVSVFARLSEREETRSAGKPDLVVEELGRAVGDALEQYFATHPPSARRARDVERMLRRNARVWQGREWYVGRTNYRDRVPRSRDARKLEWTRAEER